MSIWSLDNSASKRVLDLLKPVKMTICKNVIERVAVVNFRWIMEVAIVLAVLKLRYGQIHQSSRM